ncbi:MAG: ABC transporter ATP-binding protein [Desulfobacterales bacterium]|nr:MAG: ABC transporter ATP-binding protein [Desulfobacterales bacterium]
MRNTGLADPLLEIIDLKVHFTTDYGVVRALNGIHLAVEEGHTLGIVGESGCGKSVSALAIMGLIHRPGRIAGGEILYRRHQEVVPLHLLHPKGSKIRAIRGNDIAMIFQEPMTSLNPVFTIGYQIMEPIMLHQKKNRRQARESAVEMLRKVGIPSPERRVDEYPHQLSGGMRQRAMIAMALSCRPALLIADEPTTALDVTIQAQVLDLMVSLQKEFGASIVMITHDLGVVAGMADEVVVMYLGYIVEKADVRSIYRDPRHPYTRGLMTSMPSLITPKANLKPIKGVVPDPYSVPPGCPFEPRCSEAMPVCRLKNPVLTEVASGHQVACWLWVE